MFSPKVNSRSGLLSSVHAFEPGIDLALGLVPRHAVALLKPAAELRALTLDDVEIVVGEFAPLLLSLAFELFPIAFKLDPNSSRLSCIVFPALCFVRSAGMSSRKTLRDSKSSAALIPVPLLKKTRGRC
jgi:hypothetical protein